MIVPSHASDAIMKESLTQAELISNIQNIQTYQIRTPKQRFFTILTIKRKRSAFDLARTLK